MASKKPMTEKQRQARLENIKKARGPKTATGKERSSRNSTKHGGWARSLRAIDQGPLREDPNELEEFVNAYVAELKPGASIILRQAALDCADKAWRLTRAQRWEAQGFASADYGTREAAGAALMRFNAGGDRRLAEAVRRVPDSAVSDDHLEDALFSLGFAVGMSEEDLDWVEEADRNAVVEGLTVLINQHFGNQDEAALYLESRAADQEAKASTVEETWRPDVIRRELDGSFARNAERLVSHASRELDRAMKRYQILTERFGEAGDQGEDDGDSDPEPGDSNPLPGGGAPPKPAGGADGAADKTDIWSYMTADEIVEHFTNMTSNSSSPNPSSRNEPTDPSPAM